MTDGELKAIEARANAATPGPWRYEAPSLADAAFISAARTDVPALVAEVRRLRPIAEAAERWVSLAGPYPTQEKPDNGAAEMAAIIDAVRAQEKP